MILRNWANWASLRNRGTSGNKVTVKNTKAQTYDINTSTTTFANVITNNNYAENTGSVGFTHVGIVLGSGTTAPTVENYKIENHLIFTNVSASNDIASGNSYAGNSLHTFTQTVKNETSADITVTEIGVFGANAGSNAVCTLLTRDVINPVTVKVGETKTFTVRVDLAQMATSVQAS